MQDEDEQKATDESRLPESLVRSRTILAYAFVVLIGAELFWPFATWPGHLINTAFYLYKLGWLVVIALACAFWVQLYRYARSAGGPSYAAGHLLLSIVLMPLGMFFMPELVRGDIARGQAQWRKEHVLPASERLLRTVLYFAALVVVAPPLYLVHRDLLYLSPLLAFLLQRLVLPWCRRAGPEEPGEARP